MSGRQETALEQRIKRNNQEASAVAQTLTTTLGSLITFRPAAVPAADNSTSRPNERRQQRTRELEEELSAELQSLSLETDAASQSVRSAQRQALNAQIRALQQSNLHSDIVRTEDEIFMETRNELKDVVAQLADLKALLTESLAESNEMRDRQAKRLDEHKQIRDALQGRLKQAKEAAEQPHISKAQAEEEMKQKRKKIASENQRILVNMHKFLSKHFPVPKRAGKGSAQTLDAYLGTNPLSLQQILETIMNKAFTTPTEPYVDLDKRYWSPYVELLLRSGIATLHPRNPRKLKLTEFHK